MGVELSVKIYLNFLKRLVLKNAYQVFGPETTQKEFFQGCIMQPVKDLLKGQSRLIFTYGLTNSGKTYTFQGKLIIFAGKD